jgi:heptosyltransferase-2/heptosyltransferase-3
MANCDLFLGNSNGPSHVAVAVDIPSLQLHGTTLAASWCPLSERHRALQAGQGSEAARGPIAELSEQAVWSALEGMRPFLDKTAQSRQQIGVRMNWSPLTL